MNNQILASTIALSISILGITALERERIAEYVNETLNSSTPMEAEDMRNFMIQRLEKTKDFTPSHIDIDDCLQSFPGCRELFKLKS